MRFRLPGISPAFTKKAKERQVLFTQCLATLGGMLTEPTGDIQGTARIVSFVEKGRLPLSTWFGIVPESIKLPILGMSSSSRRSMQRGPALFVFGGQGLCPVNITGFPDRGPWTPRSILWSAELNPMVGVKLSTQMGQHTELEALVMLTEAFATMKVVALLMGPLKGIHRRWLEPRLEPWLS